MNTFDPFASKPAKKSNSAQPQNFVEALKSIGGYTVKSVAKDLVGGVTQDVVSTFTGSGTAKTQGEVNTPRNEFVNEWLQPQNKEALNREMMRHNRIKELSSTPVYDRNQEQVNKEIKALQEQLAMLAKDLGALGTSVQKAVNEQIVNPGVYHVSYFEKLKNFVVMLRKQVSESANWLEVSYSRRQAQNHYWGNVKKSGTKFMLSQERYMSTSAG